MKTPVRILHLDDNPRDTEIVQSVLTEEGIACDVTRVETRAGFLAALDERDTPRECTFDILLAEYSLPGLDGLSALAIARGKCPVAPFIFLTRAPDEELALAALKSGASDYVLKSRLSDLAPAVRRALRAAEERTERARAEQALRESEERYRLIAETAADAIITVDEAGRILFTNRAAENLFGYATLEMLDGPLTLLLPSYLQQVHPALLKQGDSASRLTPGEAMVLPGLHKSGQEIPLEVSFGKSTKDGKPSFTGILRDITERKRAEQHLNHLATHDALTGLPNRLVLLDRLNQALAQASRHRRLVAVLFLDLDRFKPINDTVGHHAGDQLLQAVAQRLTNCVRKSDTVARMGGDEFIFLFEIAQVQDAGRIAQTILETLSKPFVVEGHELIITSSIGISLYPNDGDNPELLLKNADTAMYSAKALGRNRHQRYSTALGAKASVRRVMEDRLHQALKGEQFMLYYQPQQDLNTGRIIGMEALLRWNHPELGLVAAAEFLPLAEETGLIAPIGEWVLREACAQSKAWQAAGLRPVRLGVNLSLSQLQQPGLVTIIRRLLEETGLPGSRLELELAGDLIQSVGIIDTLCSLKEAGIGIALDDFGAGPTSLSDLKHVSVDKLKIDRSLTRGIPSDPENAALTHAIIAMARGLKLKVLAEGVETAGQLEFLRSLGCDEVQGYLLSRPLPAQEASKLLAERQASEPLLET